MLEESVKKYFGEEETFASGNFFSLANVKQETMA